MRDEIDEIRLRIDALLSIENDLTVHDPAGILQDVLGEHVDGNAPIRAWFPIPTLWCPKEANTSATLDCKSPEGDTETIDPDAPDFPEGPDPTFPPSGPEPDPVGPDFPEGPDPTFPPSGPEPDPIGPDFPEGPDPTFPPSGPDIPGFPPLPDG